MAERGGHREGAGRKRGVPNKATLERIIQTANEIEERKISGKKLAKEVLEDFMHLTAGMAAHYQPAPPGHPVNASADPQEFWRCMEAACTFAKALAPFQSPTFKAIAVYVPPDNPNPRPGGENVIDLTDSETITRVYRRRISVIG